MKKNMGMVDKLIRFIVAISIAVLYYLNIISGTLAIVLLILAVIFVLTSFVSFCPIYRLIGVSTCSSK